MKIRSHFSLCALLVCFSQCNRHQPAPSATPAVAPQPTLESGGPSAVRFGAPLSTVPAIPAKTLLADPQKYNDQQIKVSGTVGGVCQKKGCWMTIGSGEPGEQTMRVSFKDYGFFVPTDCMGKQAVVEGQFKITTLPEAEAQHYADDAAKAGAPAKKITGPQQTLALTAAGVEIR